VKNTRYYANIKHLSYFCEEDEILIGLDSIVDISKTFFYDKIEQIWICKVVLSSEDNYQFKDIMKHDKQNIGKDSMSLEYLLYQMGDTMKVKEYFSS